jgi:pyruvate dehydrogenase E1 component beta subunit
MYMDFVLVAMDPFVNQMAKLRFMSGGQLPMSVTVRAQSGHGTAEGAQHSQSLEAWFMHTPGLKVCMPATVYDAKGLLKSAVRDESPVLVIENRVLFYQEDRVPEGEWLVPLGQADVARAGTDVTVVATAWARHKALAAAEQLGGEISVEVIDPRTLVPLDVDTILASVRKTGYVLVVHESPARAGVGAEIVRRIVADGFDYLDAPPLVHAGADVPTPFSPPLEYASLPQPETIAQAVRGLLGRTDT